MAISVNFGYTTRDTRWLEKNPTWTQTSVSCDIYEPTDRINPILIVDKDIVDLSDTNYMYIPEFGRYYFITNITGDAGNRAFVHGHVDVLMTYQDEIKQCKCIANRSTSNYNWYLQDSRRLINAYPYNSYHLINTLETPNTIVMMTI